MSQPVAKIKRTDSGNVVVDVNGRVEIELTPEQVDVFCLQLLRNAHPKEHMFVIPVPRDEDGAA